MAKASIKKIAKIMKRLDFCMFTTSDLKGTSSSRPMSNNKDVDYDGTSYFFTYKDTRTIREIKKNPKVSLQYSSTGVISKPLFVSVSGRANLIMDRAAMENHWDPELEIWFKKGLDTKGIVMIEVVAEHVKYWQGGDEGEYRLKK